MSLSDHEARWYSDNLNRAARGLDPRLRAQMPLRDWAKGFLYVAVIVLAVFGLGVIVSAL